MQLIVVSKLLAIALCTLLVFEVQAGAVVVVEEDFLEVRTGPGSAYPVFYVAENGEKLNLIKSSNNWVLVELKDGVSGWILNDELFLQGRQSPVSVVEIVGDRRVAINFGWFSGSGEFGLSGGLRITPRVNLDLELRQITTSFSSSYLLLPKLDVQLYPSSTWNPVVELGLGVIDTETDGVISGADGDVSQLIFLGGGLRYRAAAGLFVNAIGGSNFLFNQDSVSQLWDFRLEFESLF